MQEDLSQIGWKERVDFPDWSLEAVLSKSDTGAQTSSIDAENIEPLPRGRVRFDIVARRGRQVIRCSHEDDIIRVAEVRSSNGRMSKRYVVATTIKIGEHRFLTEVSLVPRPKMKCRVLIGRATLAGRFLVDSKRDYLLTERRPVVYHDSLN